MKFSRTFFSCSSPILLFPLFPFSPFLPFHLYFFFLFFLFSLSSTSASLRQPLRAHPPRPPFVCSSNCSRHRHSPIIRARLSQRTSEPANQAPAAKTQGPGKKKEPQKQSRTNQTKRSRPSTATKGIEPNPPKPSSARITRHGGENDTSDAVLPLAFAHPEARQTQSFSRSFFPLFFHVSSLSLCPPPPHPTSLALAAPAFLLSFPLTLSPTRLAPRPSSPPHTVPDFLPLTVSPPRARARLFFPPICLVLVNPPKSISQRAQSQFQSHRRAVALSSHYRQIYVPLLFLLPSR